MRETEFATLGLRPGATAAEIRQAYLDLAQIWHPDRFAHDPRLQRKVEQQFVEINRAYQCVRSARWVPAADRFPAQAGRPSGLGPAILTLCLAAILIAMGGHLRPPASEPGLPALPAPGANSWHFSAPVGFTNERSPLGDSYDPFRVPLSDVSRSGEVRYGRERDRP